MILGFYKIESLLFGGKKNVLRNSNTSFAIGTSVTAVSYTHLDVYKRQYSLSMTMVLEKVNKRKRK